jgi:hypothetical protein
VSGIRKRLFGRCVDSYNESLWIAPDCCEKRQLSLNVFFGDTYGTEISCALNFAANIRSTIMSWISIVRAQSWLSSWTAADITTMQAKCAIERARNSWLAMESLCCDSGIIRFAESSTACCEQSGLHSRSDRRTIPHLHPLPLAMGEARKRVLPIEVVLDHVNRHDLLPE